MNVLFESKQIDVTDEEFQRLTEKWSHKVLEDIVFDKLLLLGNSKEEFHLRVVTTLVLGRIALKIQAPTTEFGKLFRYSLSEDYLATMLEKPTA